MTYQQQDQKTYQQEVQKIVADPKFKRQLPTINSKESPMKCVKDSYQPEV